MKIKTLSLIILFFLSCCVQKESVFLSEATCEEPCWRDISLGQEKKDVLGILEKTKNVDQESYIWSRSDDINIDEIVTFHFINSRERGGGIVFKNDKIVSFDLSYLQTIKLREIIEKIGNPGKALVYSTIGGGQIYSVFYILFPDDGVCLKNYADVGRNEDFFTFTPNTKIKYIEFVDPSTDPNQLIYGCLSGSGEDKINSLENWHGYGEYKIQKQK